MGRPVVVGDSGWPVWSASNEVGLGRRGLWLLGIRPIISRGVKRESSPAPLWLIQPPFQPDNAAGRPPRVA